MTKVNHIGIIVDGNGRWAKEKGKSRSEGHKAGAETLEKIILYISKENIANYLSLYVFSTENFSRSPEEVNYLMDLFVKAFKKDKNFFIKNDIKVVFSGRGKPLSDEVMNVMKEIEEGTKDCKKGTFNFCINYGGQAEIVDTTKKIVNLVLENKLNIEELTTESYYHYLYNDLPPVDLLIRTSGEIRISNFMLYSISYAEIYFTSTCFPDFDESEFDKALESYQNRNITKGKA